MVIGENIENIEYKLVDMINQIKIDFKNIVLIFDRNLDFGNKFVCGLNLGKRIKKNFKYETLSIKLFIRSANDSKVDLDLYMRETDGFILKDYLKTNTFIDSIKEKLQI